ncbi:MAG TPA: cache domain-containing protein [bacterium]|nr:cache domain-containing protein [bacterium]
MNELTNVEQARSVLRKALLRILITSGVVGIGYFLVFKYLSDQYLHTGELMRQEHLTQLVTLARNAVEPVIQQFRAGEISREEALTQVKSQVKHFSYASPSLPNYIFMAGFDGTLHVHPLESEYENTWQGDFKDQNGRYVIREMADIAQSQPGGGFLTYWFHPPNSPVPQEKLSYVLGIPELNCFIGTGMYMADVRQAQHSFLREIMVLAFGVFLLMLFPMIVFLREHEARNQSLIAEITERQRVEEALRASEKKYRELVQSANSIIMRMDVHGNITFFNEFAERFFGYEQEEILGLNVIGTVAPRTETAVHDLARMVQELRESPEEFAVHEHENMRRSGDPVWVTWTHKPIFDSQGDIVEILSIGTDVTERRHLVEQLRQSQKMEAVGRLAGGVAHDFNNLLMAILGYCEILLLHIKPTDPYYGEIKEIQKAGERATALTRQLLAFSRKQVLQPKRTDLNTLIQNMEKMLLRLIGEDVELITQYEPSLGHVIADPGQLEQVVMNLVVNARDALPKGGTITIRTTNCVLDQNIRLHEEDIKAGSYVILSVRDTGCGMDRELLSKIFEPFFTTKERGKGTGLGLSTVYGIVKQSEGYITVESEVGKGTAFTVYLPRCEDVYELDEEEKPVIQSLRGTETILLVEDEESVRNLISRTLQQYGYNVVEASCSSEAFLQICGPHEGSIDVLLLDVVMAEMSGRELAEHLTLLYPGLKVIFMSGYTDDAILHHGILEDEVNFLQKPITPENLVRKIREILDAPLAKSSSKTKPAPG